MSNPFGERRNYHYGDIDTPFRQKGQNFDGPIGAKLNQAKLWRSWTFGILLVAVFVLIAFIYVLKDAAPNVLISEITPKGMLKSTERLKRVSTVPVAALYAFVDSYLQAVFVKSTPRKTPIDKLLHKLSSANVLKMLKPYQHSASALKITNISLLKPGIVQATWQIIPRDKKHLPTSKKVFAATFSFKQQKRISKQEIAFNPFGFYLFTAKMSE